MNNFILSVYNILPNAYKGLENRSARTIYIAGDSLWPFTLLRFSEQTSRKNLIRKELDLQ